MSLFVAPIEIVESFLFVDIEMDLCILKGTLVVVFMSILTPKIGAISIYGVATIGFITP